MIKSLWFLIQLSAIVAVAMWVLERPGHVAIDYAGYDINVEFGFFLLLLVVFFAAVFLLYQMISAIFSVPQKLVGIHQEHAHKRGYRALTRGLVAVAAGDTKIATRMARQAQKLMPGESGLPILLSAQAARLAGDDKAARRSFEKLLKDKDASFFGLKGLLQNALEAKDNRRALDFAHQALRAHPRQGWILKITYGLELKNEHWTQAQNMLPRLVKAGALSQEQARSDEAAFFMRAACDTLDQKTRFVFLKQAYKSAPYFSPVVCALGRAYLTQKKRRKVVKMVERAWKENPHPDLATLWQDLTPQKARDHAQNDPVAYMKWAERLVALKPDSAQGQIFAAQSAIKVGLWGEARAYLTIAERLAPCAEIYRLQAQVEEKMSGDSDAICAWLEKAAGAPQDKAWICQETGIIYDQWSPVATPHGGFNTIIWAAPGRHKNQSEHALAPLSLIEAA